MTRATGRIFSNIRRIEKEVIIQRIALCGSEKKSFIKYDIGIIIIISFMHYQKGEVNYG